MISPWSASVPSDSAAWRVVSAAWRLPVSYSTQPDQQGDPSGLDQDLAVLLEGDPLALECGDPAQPGPPFDQELISGHVRVLRAQPVGHDPQAVERGLVQVGTLQPADQLQRVHARHGQHIGLGVTLRRDREHRVRHRAERRRDDRLVELLPGGSTSPASQRFHCLSRLASPGSSLGACARIARTASAWLQPRALRSLAIRRAHAGRSSTIAATLLRSGLCPFKCRR